MIRILVPAHFVEELGVALAPEPVELVPYDKHGVPLADATGSEALFRWWLTGQEGDRLVRDQRLKWIHTGSAGVEHILTPAFFDSGARLTNSSGVHAPSIAEWVVAAILYVTKDLATMVEQQRRKIFEKIERPEMQGQKVVFFGAGHIAQAVATRLRPFGMHLTAVRKSSRHDPLFDESLTPDKIAAAAAECDWLIIAAPLSEETRGAINAEVIGSMRRDAWLVNVARGEIVDERALIEALRQKRIGGAVLDVFSEEPLPETSPLWELSNAIVFPHTTWRSPEVKGRQLALFAENVRRYVRGDELLNEVRFR